MSVGAALIGHAFLSGAIFLCGFLAAKGDAIIWIPVAVLIWIMILSPVHTPGGDE